MNILDGQIFFKYNITFTICINTKSTGARIRFNTIYFNIGICGKAAAFAYANAIDILSFSVSISVSIETSRNLQHTIAFGILNLHALVVINENRRHIISSLIVGIELQGVAL